MTTPRFGAGIWHFATYLDRYATDGYGQPRNIIEAIDIAGQVKDLSVVDLNWPYFGGEFSDAQIKTALDRNNLKVIGITPEIYTREFVKGAFTNPDAGVRRRAHELITDACNVVRFHKADYVKLWPGQDGWDYPFQVDYSTQWQRSLDGVGQLASENPDLKFVIEYKPREPRVRMSFGSVARTILGIERSACPTLASCSISATPSWAADPPLTPPSSPSITAAFSAWTSTTTTAPGTTTSSPAACIPSNSSSSSTSSRRTSGKASGSSISSPSAKILSPRPPTPSTSSRPRPRASTASISKHCRKLRAVTTPSAP